jgi:hypothetical protein
MMSPTDSSLTSVQSDLVNLLHEIGGVEKEERTQLSAPGWPSVTLTMVGDGGRKVRVRIDPYAGVEWEVVGERV